ncbi:hypothetical protein ACIOMM_12835 [Streptomyces sp. NPDC087908]|uniref:hypothetical protein n=1 Tax=unclassified Streptomyces TaxID=2593676 RepID=UPI0021CA7584|nr:hypothetical protein [Streptomyces sp. adm13(2018)]
MARARGVSPQRVAPAWLLGRSDTVLPIPGASRPESARDVSASGAVLQEGAPGWEGALPSGPGSGSRPGT